jgi:hypothetical protein
MTKLPLSQLWSLLFRACDDMINDTHPAYRRAVASRSEGYHIALTMSLALASLAVPPAEDHEFVTTFLTYWGEALDRSPRRPRKRR